VRRRILCELHQAVAVQEEKVVTNDPDGNEVSIYDPDFCFTNSAPTWTSGACM
jgi:hypothetical protein